MSEPDEVKWRGIRNVNPMENIQTSMGAFETTVGGVAREQILKWGSVVASLVSIYTVPAGKTLYLTSTVVTAFHTSGAFAILYLLDGDAALFGIILYLDTNAGVPSNLTQSFPMPIMVPAEGQVVVSTNGGTCRAVIQGWIQDA